jgi:hypothetical protein
MLKDNYSECDKDTRGEDIPVSRQYSHANQNAISYCCVNSKEKVKLHELHMVFNKMLVKSGKDFIPAPSSTFAYLFQMNL